jgi:hypothetical protein
LSSIDYIGPDDGTFYLVLRHRFEKEISGLKPDFKKEFNEEIEILKQENRCSKKNKIFPGGMERLRACPSSVFS